MLLLSPVLLAFAPWNQICDAKSRQIQLSVANLNIRLLHSCFVFCIFSPQKFIHSTESTLGGVFLETENSLHVSKPNNQNAVVRPSEENPLHRVLNFSFPISSD